MPRPLVVLVLLAVPVCAAPVPRAKVKAPNFDGTWEVVELRVGDQDATALNPKVWVIEGQSVSCYQRHPDGSRTLWAADTTFALVRPDGAEADAVDYVLTSGGSAIRFHGRVRVTADELTLCFSQEGQPRPTEITPGSGVSYERFKRVSEK
jgi:hypothetical protein